MSENKFTPGPWQAVRSMPAEGADCWWICAGAGNREKELAVVYAGSDTHIGNAHLIAAAPDLYEALRELDALPVQTLSAGVDSVMRPVSYVAYSAYDVQRIVRAALPKAVAQSVADTPQATHTGAPSNG